jgi:hypothetical protein
MKIDNANLITLSDGNKYYISARASIDDKKYLYLIDKNNIQNMKIGRQEIENGRIKLTIVKNDDELRKVIPLLYKDAKKNYENA